MYPQVVFKLCWGSSKPERENRENRVFCGPIRPVFRLLWAYSASYQKVPFMQYCRAWNSGFFEYSWCSVAQKMAKLRFPRLGTVKERLRQQRRLPSPTKPTFICLLQSKKCITQKLFSLKNVRDWVPLGLCSSKDGRVSVYAPLP